MKYIALTVATLTLLGCQAQPPSEKGAEKKESPKSTVQKASPKAAVGSEKQVAPKAATPTPSGPKAVGPKAVAESYELSNGTKLVSGSVVLMMQFSLIKGYLKAEKAPKAIKFTLQGSELEGYYPTVRLSIYDLEQRR